MHSFAPDGKACPQPPFYYRYIDVREALKGNRYEGHVLSGSALWSKDAFQKSWLCRSSRGFLALGIGSVTTVYTLASAVIINPMPFEESDRLLSFKTTYPPSGDSGFSVSYADFRSWQKQSRMFEHIAVFTGDSLNLSGPEGPERIQCGRTTAGFFPMLRIQPHLGRFFLPEEKRPGGAAVTVLTHALWERRYSSKDLGDAETSMLILFGAVAFVLLIACANVANLLLARATIRQKEIAIRIALGASRIRLVRQLLTESLLLAVLGGAFGMLVAAWGQDYVISMMPKTEVQFIIEYYNFRLKPEIFLFAACVVVVSTMLFGLVPALKASSPNVNAFLKEGGSAGFGTGQYRLLAGLVVSEVSLALMLLIGAGLMIRSFQNLKMSDPGFDAQHLLVTSINMPVAQYPNGSAVIDFCKGLFDQLEALPAVETAAAASILPFTHNNNSAIHIEGYPPLPPGQYYLSEVRVATSEFFKTLGIPLLSGRDFSKADWNSNVPVAIVNDAFRRRYWPDEDPLGKRFKFGIQASTGNWITVVGVVGDFRHRIEKKPKPKLYTYLVQAPRNGMDLVLHTSTTPKAVAPSLRQIVAGLDPNLPLSRITTMEELMAEDAWDEKMLVSLFSIFAGITLILASVGVYGVISYSVAQRTHEFGIRMALGAQPGNIRNIVTRQGLIMAGVGVGIGLVCAFGLTQMMASMLYEIEPGDPITYAAVSIGLAAIVLLAGYVPARKATKVEPIVALRYE